MSARPRGLGRLLSPSSIAFVGGAIAEMAIRRCLDMGYEGKILPVNPKRDTMAGLRCYPSIEDLPSAPDAAFIGVSRDRTLDVVKSLAAADAGGCVCYAAGYAEIGGEGRVFQERLIEAAGEMPLVGPNCVGFINYLDRCALWPYLFGGGLVERGVALISQSGNIAMNLTMSDRSVRFTHVIGTGNQAVLGAGDYLEALLEDSRVSVIGMYVEGFDDVERFSRAAMRALSKGIPIVIMKMGKTEAAARQASSHTNALVGSDKLYDALFDRLGVIRVDSLSKFLECLKMLDRFGPLAGRNIVTLSCSGGEAAMIADAVRDFDLETRPFSDAQIADFASQFPDYVTVTNPFDYNTSVWGDRAAMERCFSTAMKGGHDAVLLIYDHPTVNAPEVDEWEGALDAFIAAHKSTGTPAFVVSTISEMLPSRSRDRLLADGVIPLQGLEEAFVALSAAAWYHTRRNDHARRSDQARRNDQARGTGLPRFAAHPAGAAEKTRVLDEWDSKCMLRDWGLRLPEGGVGTAAEAPNIADRIGYPVVVKAVGTAFAHKTDQGAVILDLPGSKEVIAAIDSISAAVQGDHGPVERFLVERMISGAVAELIIGIKRDDQFGPALVIGAGGVLVELISDSVSLLLPTDRFSVETAIDSLKTSKLLNGFRGKPAGDIKATVDAILAIAALADKNWDRLVELDVNPLMVLPEGQGVVVADALIRLSSD